MKIYFSLLAIFIVTLGYAQDNPSNYRSKMLAAKDTIVIDSVSINTARFQLLDKNGRLIDSLNYTIDFKNSFLVLSDSTLKVHDSIRVNYMRYPNFLTKDYTGFDPKIIVKNTGLMEKLYSLDQDNSTKKYTPFDGLNTIGSISRGITIGNNQNTVVNSELDLQITGKLSEKVSIRASIQDANIPTQEGGYSQSLDEFDQIFIELFSDNWNIRAGDVDLENRRSYFGQFSKKIQGISLGGTINHNNGAKTTAFAAGALVRGVFAESKFTG